MMDGEITGACERRVSEKTMRLVLLALLNFFAVSLGLLEGRALHGAETGQSEPTRRPDWLSAKNIEALLSGNTVTALSGNSSSRWWSLYLEDGSTSWVNDLGERAFGIWYLYQDQLCEVWKPDHPKCWGIRFTGKVIRFDDPFTGKPYAAAVLQAGDTRNLRAQVTPEVYEALQELRESQSEAAATARETVDGNFAAIEGAQNINTGALSRLLKLRIVHPDSQEAEDLINALSGVQLAAVNEYADLVWDVVRGEISKDNEIIAYPRTNEPSEVQLVIDALHLIDDMEELMAERADGLSLQLAPERDSYRAGETITVTLVNQNGRYALLFNVDPYGEIDIVYPVETDFAGDGDVWPGIAPARPLSLAAVAGPPFGANLIVGLVSPTEPRSVLKTLQSGGGPAGISAFLKVLRETEGQVAVSSFWIHR